MPRMSCFLGRNALRRVPLGLGLALVAAGGALIAGGSTSSATGVWNQQLQEVRRVDYGKLPLAFAMNAGQSDPRIHYSSRGPGFSAFLTSSSVTLGLEHRRSKGERRAVSLSLRFLQANKRVVVRGQHRGPTRINYLLGNDP